MKADGGFWEGKEWREGGRGGWAYLAEGKIQKWRETDFHRDHFGFKAISQLQAKLPSIHSDQQSNSLHWVYEVRLCI